jgi:hypothetical protein
MYKGYPTVQVNKAADIEVAIIMTLRTLEMFAKNWLAHDGCWFLAAEERLGMQTAIELDERAWQRFAATEARRIIGGIQYPAKRRS